jgi:hypothetical protein
MESIGMDKHSCPFCLFVNDEKKLYDIGTWRDRLTPALSHPGTIDEKLYFLPLLLSLKMLVCYSLTF